MIDGFVRTVMAEQHIPGLALVIQRGETILHEGYYGQANLEHDVPVHENTVFEIASVTKLFTAQAVLRLVQDGKIDLDTPLSAYLDDLPAAWNAVIVRHCLSHQSGIPSYTGVDRYWQLTRAQKSYSEILDLVRDLPLNFPPGARYSYDNTGFYLLGMLIETVSGQTYGDYLKATIFEPLGMTHTRVNNYEEMVPNRAQGYIYRDNSLYNKPFYDTSNTFSAGNLLCRARDLVTWRSSLTNNTILNADTRALWWKPHPSEAANEQAHHFSVGLGWFLLDDPIGQFYGHNGGIAGFSSAFLYIPHVDTTAVVLCNVEGVSDPHQIALNIIRDM